MDIFSRKQKKCFDNPDFFLKKKIEIILLISVKNVYI